MANLGTTLRRLVPALALAASCAHAPGAAPADENAATTTSSTPALPDSASVNVGCGFLVAEHHGNTSFSFVEPGEVIHQKEGDPKVLLLDGIRIESAIAHASQLGDPRLRGRELLRRYMAWESAYLSKEMGWPALHLSEDPAAIELPGFETLFWGFEAPKPYELEGVLVNRVAYLTIAIDGEVLALATVFRPEDDVRPAGRLLRRIAKTLRREPRPVDIFAVSRAARASEGPLPEVCSRVGPP